MEDSHLLKTNQPAKSWTALISLSAGVSQFGAIRDFVRYSTTLGIKEMPPGLTDPCNTDRSNPEELNSLGLNFEGV
jgi:hypothetical protein